MENRLCLHFKSIDEKKVNNIQKIIVEHKESPFNKGAITCKLTNYGHISLTNKNYTETFKGTKINVNRIKRLCSHSS